MAVGYDYELYVDGARVFYGNSSFEIYCGEDRFTDMSGYATGSYSYNAGQYAGWTTIQGSTTPEYAYQGQSPVSDIIIVPGKVYLYSIPATASAGKMYLGTSSISKMYFGQNEVSKVYLGQDLVYEKQAPSGYTVGGTSNAGQYQTAYYSTDNGSTWNAIPTGSFTLPAMTTFKIKIGGYADYLMSATSTQLGLNLPLTETREQTSSNYTLTQNITDLTIHGEWD